MTVEGTPSRVVPADPDPALLRVYLNDHLAAATAAVGLARRLAEAHRETAAGERLHGVAAEVAAQREALLKVMGRLGVRRTGYKEVALALGERLGRFKPNGRLVSRSPLSTLIELEGMWLAVQGLAWCWRVLRDLSADDVRLAGAELEDLLSRADKQADVLERLRSQAVSEVFQRT